MTTTTTSKVHPFERPRLLVDANSWLNQALLRGTDHEGRIVTDPATGKPVQVNSAQYGVDNFERKFKDALEQFDVAPVDCVFVWDGPNAKAYRRTFLERYKEGRDKLAEVSVELNAARDQLTQMLRDIGSIVVRQEQREADDVLGYIAKVARNRRNIVCTADGDMTVLVDENTDVWRGGVLNENPYGPFPHRFITLYKALVGDAGDKIPGAKGFGDAAWTRLVATFGFDGLQALEDLVLTDQLKRLEEDVADCPPLQAILNDIDGVRVSWRVARLMVDKVNTMHAPWDVQAGMVRQLSELADTQMFLTLRHFYGTKTLVTAENYVKVVQRFQPVLDDSEFVSMDIEASTPEASDEWAQRIVDANEGKGKKEVFDSLGFELTSMAITAGRNQQHTIYMTVDHKDSDNITVEQCRQMCERIPQEAVTVIQNRSFEFNVLWRTWGEKQLDNGWYGMPPNAVDSKLGASYVDENAPGGLKERSAKHLDYKQATFEETTTLHGPVGSLDPRGTLKSTYSKVLVEAEFVEGPDGPVETVPAATEQWESRQYKMNQLTAQHCFDYGCDDTICTSALHVYYSFVMDVEQSLDAYYLVEQLPEYLTSLAFVQGIPFSLSKMMEMSKRDDERYDKAWATLRDFLMARGWEGTLRPVIAEVNPTAVKLAAAVLLDTEDQKFSTRKSKLNAMAADIRAQFDTPTASLLAAAVEAGDAEVINRLVKENFTGEPKINFDSPKQMQTLFYRHMGVRPRILNAMTQKQREENTVMRSAFYAYRDAKDAKVDLFTLTEPVEVLIEKAGRRSKRVTINPLSQEGLDALISKASTDDDAVELALARDVLTEEQTKVLKAFQSIKQVMTRRKLFYKPYLTFGHWRDGRLHPSLNQSEAVTRRYSASKPNVQQLPKRGEGVEFREIILPHCKDAVVVSLDFNGQELRLVTDYSHDENMTACYIGTDLKDPHSLTAVAAAPSLWGEEISYAAFRGALASHDKVEAKRAKDLRNDAKTVNFGTQYDLQAPGLAVKLKVDEETAQEFIDAKDRAFPGIGTWKEGVRAEVEECGYATSKMGARRHLAHSVLSEDRWVRAEAGRQGPNFKIQSSGAEMTKMAMGQMWLDRIFTGRFNARFYAPVHDEVVFSVHRDDAFECIKAVHKCMTQPFADMWVPIVSSISLGANFGKQIECGEVPDKAAIEAAIVEALGA